MNGTYRLVMSVVALVAVTIPLSATEAPSWVATSDAHAEVLLEVLARFNPEAAGQFGIDGLDEEIFSIPVDAPDRQVAALEAALAELEARKKKATHPAVVQDLDIMIDSALENIEGIEVYERHLVPYFNLSQTIFQGIKSLLDPRLPAERYGAAVVRLNKYTGLHEGFEPLTEQAMAFTRARLADESRLGPYRGEIEKDLSNHDRFVTGLKELFVDFELEGWEPGYDALEAQLDAYRTFLAEEVMARARDDFRLPRDVYAYNLKTVGIDMPVGELQSRAKTTFREIQNEMQAIAHLVAKERGWEATDYRDVIRKLKEEQVVGEAILPLYEQRIGELEEIARAEDVVTLPERDMVIRLASEAESAAIPAPHMSPPRLMGNTGEMGEFVLPLSIPGEPGEEEVGFDDFTFDAASWTLTVHEGRPGHEMQFASIIEKGVSKARILFAFNSVNVEGWALYTEAEMKPYLPLDGQLISLQHRLLRAARAHLDPGLQLGTITKEEAFQVLEGDVVLSHAMALQEVERYTFWAPGQATAYFCGYSRLMEIRTDAERMLGDAFDRKAFHDFVLAQGLLPPSLLRQAVVEEFVGPRMAEVEKPIG